MLVAFLSALVKFPGGPSFESCQSQKDSDVEGADSILLHGSGQAFACVIAVQHAIFLDKRRVHKGLMV